MLSQRKQESMNKSMTEVILLPILFFCCSIQTTFAQINYQKLLSCLQPRVGTSDIIYNQNAADYTSIYMSSIRNLMFVKPDTRKPNLIITPTTVSHVQATVLCAKKNGIPIRVRSGGHDYEGLSYREVDNSHSFIIVDLAKLRQIDVDVQQGTAWVQAGATVGELYYNIASKTNLYGYPAAVCPTVGTGGHISGGGFGTLSRKYGLASDNVIDAIFIDVNGNIRQKDSMGEDLFWAIRGGGGTSFGIVVSWKVKLVSVPPVVAVFLVNRNADQGAIDLVTKWQSIAPRLHEDLFIRTAVQQVWDGGKRQLGARFTALFLGNCLGLIQKMRNDFPDLGIQMQDCKEMSWIQSVLKFSFNNPDLSKEVLLERGTKPDSYFKAKSDFVKVPIPKLSLEKVLNLLIDDNAGMLIMDPHGAKMDTIQETATPFPHRNGNLYSIQYYNSWTTNDTETYNRRMTWIRNFYNQMGPFVSSNPRGAYINYRDLDLGANVIINGTSSYEKGRIWGEKYFKGNYKKLALVKGTVDPADFFRNEQSIPPFNAVKEMLFSNENYSSM